LKLAFDNAGIQIPCPQMPLHRPLRQPVGQREPSQVASARLMAD